MKSWVLVVISVAATIVAAESMYATASGATKDSGSCGWLIAEGRGLREQADESLNPADARPLAVPPKDAKAAYCVRDIILTIPGDERLLKIGLPLVIRSEAREAILEASPTVLFKYRKVDGRYVPEESVKP